MLSSRTSTSINMAMQKNPLYTVTLLKQAFHVLFSLWSSFFDQFINFLLTKAKRQIAA